MASRPRTIARWDALSVRQRSRYLRAGITREQYVAGVSLSSARGHRETPEHPERVRGREQEFGAYLARARNRITRERRERLINKIAPLLRDHIDIRGQYDYRQIESGVWHMSPATFTIAEKMSLDDWLDMSQIGASWRHRDDILMDWDYAYYDDETAHWINPFWYH